MKILQSRITTYIQTSSANRFLFFLWVIVLVSSCRKPENDIFNSPDPNDKNGLIYTDTFSLQLKTVLVLDTFNTFGFGPNDYILTGQFSHPVFGTVSSRAFFQLIYLSNSKFRTAVPPASELDSTIVTLPYKYYYGDTTQRQTFFVYRLPKRYKLDGKDFPVEKSSKVNFILEEDSLFSFTTSIRPTGNAIIKFRADVLGEILTSITINDYVSLDRFLDALKGFAIVPSSSNTCVIGIDPFLSSTRVYYTDSLSETFSFFGPSTTQLNQEIDWFHYIESDRRGTILRDLQNWYDALPLSAASNNMVYAQQGTGVRIEVKIPAFDDLKSRLGEVVIHRADLEIKMDPNPPFAGVPALSAYVLDQNSRINTFNGVRELVTQIATVSQSETRVSTVIASPTGNPATYTLPMALVLQNIVNGSRKNNGFIISPVLGNDRDGFNILMLRQDQFKLKVYYLKTN